MSERIQVEQTDHVLTITNNDPATRNSLTPEFYIGLREKIEAVSLDSGVRAIVLTGAGNFFCSGGNLQGLKERSQATRDERMGSVSNLHDMISAIRLCPKPIIAAIEGGAAGAGVPLALACDMIVAARDAYMSIAYIRIGLTPDGGTTAFLGPAIPRQLLSEMIMTGDRIDVARLKDLGVINALSEPGTALTEAHSLARRLSLAPPAAIAYGKQLIRSSNSASFADQLDAEASGIADALGGPEAREGIAAFLEKRQPDWR
ncbi:MAG: oxepin-CoA hydrolase, alternative type [Hyphomicrobiaceae bacterium]